MAPEVLEREFEQIEILRDEAAHCVAFVVIHCTRLGPAFGGIRRWPYRSPQEALDDGLQLARAMTLKCAIAGVPGGGGKAVIVQHPELDRAAAYRLIGRHVEVLGGRYCTGSDVGTAAPDLAEVARWTSYVAAPGPSGPGNLAEPTAIGVAAGIEAVAKRLGFRDLAGVSVAVQGLGEVGWRLAKLVREAGGRLTVADPNEERTARARDELDAAVAGVDEIAGTACDVFAPCALGGVIDETVAQTLRARAVAGSANNVLAAPRWGAALFARGILLAPDFVINAGALIHGALFFLDGRAPPRDRIRAIGDVVGDVLDRAMHEDRPPEVLAEELALSRIAAAPRDIFIPEHRRLQ